MQDLKTYRVTYLGKRPRSSQVVEMTATVTAADEADARRQFYRTRSIRHTITTIKQA
jgi:hypothetical protein